MNIVHLISNKVWGGGERYALDLCTEAAGRGNDVKVFCRKIEAVAAPFRKAGLNVSILPLRGAFDIVSPLRLSKALDAMEGETTIHVHNFKDAGTAIRARKLMRAPERVRIICTRHLIKPAKTDRSSLERYRELDAIVFVSKYALDEFLTSNPDIDRRKLSVIYNSIKPPCPTTKNDENRPSSAVNLIFAGRIHPEKGLDVLVKALALLSDLDVKLTVCGTGDSRDVMPVVRLARGLDVNNRIEWAGHVDDVFEYIRRADIGVLPSVFREPFGLVLLEFMSQALPVVATDAGAQLEIIDNEETGLIVKAGDEEALATAIRTLTNDREKRLAMGAKAAAAVKERFGYDTFYNEIMRVYRGEL